MNLRSKANKRSQTSLINEPAKKRRKNTKEIPKTPTSGEASNFQTSDADKFIDFEPSKYQLFDEAHKKVGKLVMEDGPYRKKLLDLASLAIEKYNDESSEGYSGTEGALVDEAWDDVKYAWCSKEHGVVERGKACAFTWYTENESGGKLPLIVFCDKFKVAQKEKDQKGFLAQEKGKNYALLFFFRKIKHEFLHALQRHLEIKYKGNYTTFNVTPEYMTPLKRNSTEGENFPEAGDYDEEEDSGGPIVPFNPSQKFSNNNPLCLYYKEQYIPLNSEDTRLLLDLNLYKFDINDKGIEERKHNGLWNARDSRVFNFERTKNHFNRTFFEDRERFPKQKGKRKQRANTNNAERRLSAPGIPIQRRNDNRRQYTSDHYWRYYGQKYYGFIPKSSEGHGYAKLREAIIT